MFKILEPCAFSRACVNPGPRRILNGTNLEYCEQHIQLFEPLALEISGGERSGRQSARGARSMTARFGGVNILEIAGRKTTTEPSRK
jgi:hypothetical protein